MPCFFVGADHRKRKVAESLLTAAVEHAAAAGGTAIEGFPLSGNTRRFSGSDLMTGNEELFVRAGFEPVDRPSTSRVIMRRTLT